MPARKVATCCYCGTRAALVLDRARHELVCSSCGAPLHDLKMLPTEHPGQRELVKPSRRHPEYGKTTKSKKSDKSKKWNKKKRFAKKAFSEFFDIVEDIFD